MRKDDGEGGRWKRRKRRRSRSRWAPVVNRMRASCCSWFSSGDEGEENEETPEIFISTNRRKLKKGMFVFLLCINTQTQRHTHTQHRVRSVNLAANKCHLTVGKKENNCRRCVTRRGAKYV